VKSDKRKATLVNLENPYMKVASIIEALKMRMRMFD